MLNRFMSFIGVLNSFEQIVNAEYYSVIERLLYSYVIKSWYAYQKHIVNLAESFVSSFVTKFN